MHKDSIYGKRAIKAGLEPETSSVMDVCCAENGLDPKKTSFLDLASKKAGKSLTVRGAEDLFGKNWVHEVLR